MSLLKNQLRSLVDQYEPVQFIDALTDVLLACKEKLVTHGSKHDMSEACEILCKCVGLVDQDTEVTGELVLEDISYYHFAFAVYAGPGCGTEGTYVQKAIDPFVAEAEAKKAILAWLTNIPGVQPDTLTLMLTNTTKEPPDEDEETKALPHA